MSRGWWKRAFEPTWRCIYRCEASPSVSPPSAAPNPWPLAAIKLRCCPPCRVRSASRWPTRWLTRKSRSCAISWRRRTSLCGPNWTRRPGSRTSWATHARQRPCVAHDVLEPGRLVQLGPQSDVLRLQLIAQLLDFLVSQRVGHRDADRTRHGGQHRNLIAAKGHGLGAAEGGDTDGLASHL